MLNRHKIWGDRAPKEGRRGRHTSEHGSEASASEPCFSVPRERRCQLNVAIWVGVTVTPSVFRSAMARWISSPSPLKAT